VEKDVDREQSCNDELKNNVTHYKTLYEEVIEEKKTSEKEIYSLKGQIE